MVVCPDCGTAASRPDARFCGRCGALLPRPAEQQAAALADRDGGDDRERPDGGVAPAGEGPLRRRWWAAALSAAVVVPIAVAVLVVGGDNEVADDSSPEVAAYLTSVEQIVREEADALRRLETALDGTYADRQAWLAGIDAAVQDIPPVEELLAAARDLEPPRGYDASHDAWLASLEQLETLGQGFARGIERGDALNVTIAAQRFWLDLGQVLLIAPRPLCDVLAPMTTILPHEREFCRDPATLPGDAYGRQVWTTTRRLAVEVFPRTGVVPPSFTEEEHLAYVALTQPEVDRALNQALSELTDLRPPGHLRDDHAALTAFLAAMGENGREVALAAQAGDAAGVTRLSDQANALARRFEGQLSDAGRELLILLLLE